MALQPSSNRQEIQNRKILEDIQLQKKQLLLKQGTVQSAGNQSFGGTIGGMGTSSEAHILPSSQRSALQTAHGQSFGYFITQDSLFGNLILPVIPRLEQNNK